MADKQAERLAEAVRLHQAGALEQAIRGYRQVLRKAPRHARALNLIGHAYGQIGDKAGAIAFLQRAIAADPKVNGAHYSLGALLQAAGRNAEAAECYARAIALLPDDFRAHNNLGNVLVALNRHAEGIEHLEKAVALKPDFAEMQVNLGAALIAAGRHQEALSWYEKAAALKPGMPEAHLGIGNTLQQLGRHGEAIERFRGAMMVRDSEAHMNTGVSLQALGRYEEALEEYRKALALKPDHADALLNCANTLNVLDRYEEAEQHYAASLESAARSGRGEEQPEPAAAAAGALCRSLGVPRSTLAGGAGRQPTPQRHRAPLERRTDRAAAGGLGRSGSRRSGDVLRHGARASAVRALGDSGGGAAAGGADGAFVSRCERPGQRSRRAAAGASDPGAVDQPGPALPPLVGGFSAARARLSRRRRGTHAGAARAARRRRPPRRRPVVDQRQSADRRLQERGAARLRAAAAPAGLALRRPAIRRHLRPSARRWSASWACAVERLPDVDNFNDIDALAALISACDLVVTVSNTTAHLAGALGQNTALLAASGHARQWYWFQDRSDSPWYPRMRIVRQKRGEPWAQVIAAARDDIAALIEPA